MGLNTSKPLVVSDDMLDGDIQHVVKKIIESNNATFDINIMLNHVNVCMKSTLATLAILQGKTEIINALIKKRYHFTIPRKFVDCGDYLPKNIEEVALLSNNQEIIQHFLKNNDSFDHLFCFQYCKDNKSYYVCDNQLPKAVYLLDEMNSLRFLRKYPQVIELLDFKEILSCANVVFLKAFMQENDLTFLPISEYLFKNPIPLKNDYELYCDLTTYQIYNMLWLNDRRAKCLNILNNTSYLSDERKYYLHQIALNEAMRLNDSFFLTPQTNKLYQQCYHADYDYLDISSFISGVLKHKWYYIEEWLDELIEFTRFMNVRDRIPNLEEGILDDDKNLIRNLFDTYSESLIIDNLFPESNIIYDIQI